MLRIAQTRRIASAHMRRMLALEPQQCCTRAVLGRCPACCPNHCVWRCLHPIACLSPRRRHAAAAPRQQLSPSSTSTATSFSRAIAGVGGDCKQGLGGAAVRGEVCEGGWRGCGRRCWRCCTTGAAGWTSCRTCGSTTRAPPRPLPHSGAAAAVKPAESVKDTDGALVQAAMANQGPA